jgi:electron transfer flavoprotein alpha subunit
MAENRDIWVLLEAEENKLHPAAAALLDEGGRLARELKSQLHAVYLGPELEGLAAEVGTRGGRRLYLGRDAGWRQYDPFLWEPVLTALLKKYRPGLLLALASSSGADLLPRLAFKLNAPLVTACADIEVRSDGSLLFLKPVQNGRLFANIPGTEGGLQLATFLPERLSVAEPPGTESPVPEILPLELVVGDQVPQLCLKGYLQADPRTIDISAAQVIVAIGRGLGGPEQLAAAEAFADAVSGAIGGTRPMVDEKIIPYERQIGQTGKRVAPKLIFLCGISGAVEFTQGIRNAGCSLAINSDPQAPILNSVDLGIVGDLHQLLPRLRAHVVALKSAEQAEAGGDRVTTNGGHKP